MTNSVVVVIEGRNDTDSVFADVRKDADSLSDSLGKSGLKAGNSLGKGMTSGVDSALAGLGKSPYAIAAIAAIGVSAAPALGAAVSAGIIGGVGAGGVIGAAMLLKDEPRLKAAGEGLAENLTGRLKQSAAPALSGLLSALDDANSRVDTIGTTMDDVFAQSGGNLGKLVTPLLDGVENVTSAIGDLSDEIGPVFDAFGGAGKTALDAVAGGLRSLSDNGVEAAAAIEAFGKMINLGIDVTFAFINGLTEIYGWSLKVRSALGDDGATEALEKFKTENYSAADAADHLSESEETLAEKAEEAAKQQKELNDQIFAAAALNISAAEAELRYADALDTATEAIDNKTEVSRDEESALLDLASASNTVTEKMYEQGASVDELSAQTDGARKDLIRMAKQMGYNQSEAEKLADKYLAIPNDVKTRLEVINATKQGIQAVQNALAKIPREIFTTVYTNRLDKGRAAGGPVMADGISGAASGGSRGGLTWVGEMGPELVRLPYGASVIENGRAMAMAGGGGGGPVLIEFVPKPGASNELLNAIMAGINYRVRNGQQWGAK